MKVLFSVTVAAVACNGEFSVSSVWTTRWLIRRAASPAGQSPLSRVYPRRESCSSPSLQSCRATIGTLVLCNNSFNSSKLLFTPLIFHCTRFSMSIFTSLFGLAWKTSLGRAPQVFSCSARRLCLHHHCGGCRVTGRRRRRTIHWAWIPVRLGSGGVGEEGWRREWDRDRDQGYGRGGDWDWERGRGRSKERVFLERDFLSSER